MNTKNPISSEKRKEEFVYKFIPNVFNDEDYYKKIKNPVID